jgi:endonuclease-3
VKPETRRVRRIFALLRKAYPDAHCELDHRDAFQLLVATILSAQCTDRAVNAVTPALFREWPTAEALARAAPGAVETRIKTLGLFRGKARNLVGAAQALVRDHGGRVPDTMEALVALPGVGRKTANVVLSNAFSVPGLPVDTHVLRLGRRLDLFRTEDPVKAEAALGALLPPKDWGLASHLLIWHGRRLCSARNPRCEECPLKALCPSAKSA